MFKIINIPYFIFFKNKCVKCEQLTQPASVTVQPGQRLTITCQVSYSLSSYYTAWIRQPAGKGMEWISSDTNVKDSLKNKFSVNLDSSSNTVTLNGQNVQPEDTAVYYCLLIICCSPGAADRITVSCLTQDFYPKSLTFQWTDASEKSLTAAVQYPPAEKNNKYTRASSLTVSKSEWDSRRPYSCSVTHPGDNKCDLTSCHRYSRESLWTDALRKPFW
uniref:Ig-like domain-containing protein n=1 Tax=Sander lucioperca TaxID=283035 RepID=A0A8C9YA34_SANLU